MDSIFLDHCWVCEQRFTSAIPPGPETEERHHIIPQQAGGKDGPQVSLCSRHHQKLHNIALRLKSKKPYFDITAGEPPERIKKLLWLATRVHDAFELVRNDPNKMTSVVLSIDREMRGKLDYLKKIYPQLKSREAIVNFAIDALYQKHHIPE